MLSNMEDYSEYIIQGEPDKRERVRNWMTAIGLQDVDDLKPSQYFLDTVRQNIEGKITLEEVRRLVDQYYTAKEGLQQENVGAKWEENKNDFVKPKDSRELAHLSLARTFVQERAEAKLAWNMPSAAESLKENRTFKNDDATAAQESTQENAGSTQESTQETSKSTQEMILDEIRKHPFTTRQQLAKVIGITPDGIKKQLEKLKKANLIKHVGPTKGGHWEIIK